MSSPTPPRGSPPRGGAEALLEALGRGEIGVLYQPVVRVHDAHPVMVEALARWQPDDLPIAPETFVRLAERSGLARALSMAVTAQALSDLAAVRRCSPLMVSINLPLSLLLETDLPLWLGRALTSAGIRPSSVKLELTETTRIRDLGPLRRALIRLREIGHGVLMDDIGEADERMRLLRLPFTGIKLDRALVERLPHEARMRREVGTLVRLANANDLSVVAEGISDRRLWLAVRGLGVHFAQGFAVGRPLPATEIATWSAGWRHRPIR